jgi:hypothetical protein
MPEKPEDPRIAAFADRAVSAGGSETADPKARLARDGSERPEGKEAGRSNALVERRFLG